MRNIILMFWDVFVYSLKIRTKPKTLQLPITSRCNSRCKTCNVWKTKERIDIDPEQLKRALEDSYFSNITSDRKSVV